MQSIQDIIDTEVSLGFSYFYGLQDGEGYLRRMLHTNPSLELIYSQLRDDIQFISEADVDYFRSTRQLKAFKKLKKYLLDAKKYTKTQLEKKRKKSKSEQDEIQAELRELAKELRNGLIEKEDYDYAVKILLKPSEDNIDEVKSKFEQIDQQVKKELKKVGYEEENLDFTEEDEEDYYEEFKIPRESKEFNIEKLVDDKNRRYTMEEFNDLYEDMIKVKEGFGDNPVQNPAAAADPVTKKIVSNQEKLRKDTINSLIKNKKLPPNIQQAQLQKMTLEQLIALAKT